MAASIIAQLLNSPHQINCIIGECDAGKARLLAALRTKLRGDGLEPATDNMPNLIKAQKQGLKLSKFVFIENIECGLHPKAQYTLLDKLRTSFPESKFFITTHSPVILMTTKPNEAAELIKHGDEIKLRTLGNPSEWRMDDLLYHAFHIAPTRKNKDELDGEHNSLIEFNLKVKAWIADECESSRDDAKKIYKEIASSFPYTDSRLRIMQPLYTLLKK